MNINKILASFLSASFCVLFAVSYTNASNEVQLLLGDANLNGTIDSVDASLILGEYSASSTGGTSTLDSTQKKCADVDRNSTIDSVDASHVLAYYAYISTGGKSNIVDFLDGEYEPAATTTTKQPETTATQAPVIEEPTVDEFILENIDKSAGVLEWYSSALMNEMMQGYYIETEYNDYVTGGVESEVLLTMLNKDYEIDDDVLSEVFNCYSDDEIRNSVKFFYMYADVINSLGSNVDYVKYTLNEKIGIYLNELDNAYRNGQIDEFLFNSFENGMIPEECLNNPGVMSILCSYDKNKTYLNSENYDDTFVYEFVENIIRIKNSKAYTS